jgi:hypothetical protein
LEEKMAKRPNVSTISRARAEADFATWSMMAKLGSFSDLSSDAQRFLTSYQQRLATMDEKAAAAATIDEIDAAYLADMKNNRNGTAADYADLDTAKEADVIQLKEAKRVRASRDAARTSSTTGKRPLPAGLIFLGLVVAIVAYRFLTGSFGG